MPESPIMIYCHKCGHWSGPSNTSHGLKFKCSNCKYPVKVNRYPETNRWSVGANTRPPDDMDNPGYSEPPTLAEVAVRQPPAPKAVIPGRVIESSSHTAIATVAGEMLTDIARTQQQKRTGRREPSPYDVFTPTNITYCVDCVEGNLKPRGTFPIGDYEVRLPGSITKRLCRNHAEAYEIGFCLPRSISSRRVFDRPPMRAR